MRRIMTTCIVLLLATIPALFAQTWAAGGNAQQLVREVATNELRAQEQDRTLWMYVAREEEHGKQGVRQVIDTEEGPLSVVIARNGQPLDSQQQQLEKQRIEKLIRNPDEQTRELRRYQHDAEQAKQLTKLLPEAFLFRISSGDQHRLRLSFRPNPAFHPATREARVFHAMQGQLVVDAAQKRFVELRGVLTEDVHFGGGILGNIRKGGTFDVQQTEVLPGHWELTLIDVHISGKALLFKTINEQQHETRSDFRRVPDKLTLAQAAEMLEKQVAVAELRR